MRKALLLAALTSMVLAGCSGNAASDAPQEEFQDSLNEIDVQATATTGVVRGIVVDSAIRPLQDAVVRLTVPGSPALEASTTAGGAFGFDGLAGGTYFLRAHKAGYFDAQTSVEVVVGVADPPVTKILLETDAAGIPYTVPYTLDGFIECGTSAIAVCGGVNDVVSIVCFNTDVCLPPPTNDQYSQFMAIQGTPDWVTAEMFWESNQALGEAMSFALRYAEHDTYLQGMYEGGYRSVEGASPLFSYVTGDEAAESELGNRTGLMFSIFSGNVDYPVGVTLEQEYRFILHAFYGYAPPEDWRFSQVGAPPDP